MNFGLLDQASAAQSGTQAQGNNVWQMVLTIGIWVVVIAAAYFLFIRPQRKKQKQEEELRNSIEIGDDVTTIGGIVGRVIAVREDDDTIIVETGSDKTRMRFKKWAIASVDTPDKQPKTPEKKGKEKDAETSSEKEKEDKERKKESKRKSDEE